MEPATARIEDAGWPTELRRSHAELRAASGDGCSSRCRYTRNSERRSAKPESQASRPRGSSHSVISFPKPETSYFSLCNDTKSRWFTTSVQMWGIFGAPLLHGQGKAEEVNCNQYR